MKESNGSIIVGIDLGTSTTEAALIREGKPCMVPVQDGTFIMPSAVGVDDTGKLFAGEKARSRYMMHPESTVIEVKRKIGTEEKITLGGKKYTPVELSAEILSGIKKYISEFAGEEVSRAVISVPAYFDDLQRRETVEAGKLAGFEVERILNEPTAAALSYGLGHMEEESHILVYDLGGGTFDVTLLEMFGGVLEVKASSGDNALGGKDFDEVLAVYLEKKFKEVFGVDLADNLYARVKVKEEAEACKKALSTEDSYRILLPMLEEKDGEPLAMDITVTAEEFKALTRELVDRTHHPIDVVLGDGKVKPEDIDKILLVGGSTRMPMIAEDIENYLHMAPSRLVDPDYAVAQGAAIQAGILSGKIHQEESVIMTDVNPYTLGIRIEDEFTDDRMSVIIPRNVTIPVTKSQMYYTSWDYQTAADIEVFQGEERIASRNHFLGKFTISGIPPKKAGAERIGVEFSYDMNGMLRVKANIVSTGNEAEISIDMMKEKEGETSPKMDVSKWKDAPNAKAFKTVIRRAERVLKNLDSPEEINCYQEDLEECIYLLKRALIEDNIEEANDVEEELLGLLEDLE